MSFSPFTFASTISSFKASPASSEVKWHAAVKSTTIPFRNRQRMSVYRAIIRRRRCSSALGIETQTDRAYVHRPEESSVGYLRPWSIPTRC